MPPMTSEGIDTPEGDRGLQERAQQAKRVDKEIHEARSEYEGERGPTPEEQPAGNLPGPHARLLEPEKTTREDEEGESVEFLRFEAVLPDDRFGRLLVRFPVPEPGPLLRLLYAFLDIDPVVGEVSDLVGEDVPVRPIEIEGETRWVLDLPPGIPSPIDRRDGDFPIDELKHRLPMGSDLLYSLRRRAEEADLITWEGEHFPGSRLFTSESRQTRLEEIRAHLEAENHIGHVLPTAPRLTWIAQGIAFGPPVAAIVLSALAGSGAADQMRTAGIVLFVAVFAAVTAFTTWSVRRDL